jgi:hypothetical protein
MITRSSKKWKCKAGTWDPINVELLVEMELEGGSMCLNATQSEYNVEIICNHYKDIIPGCLVSTFVDDYILERFWNHPQNYIERFKPAAAVMSPDFSLLVGMPEAMIRWQIYKNRFVGAYWAHHGLNVIPTVGWADQESFSYCFDGIKPGSIVAVSNIGCRNQEARDFFDLGLAALKERIQPSKIIFKCAKALRKYYESENIVFLNSYWDEKRKNHGRT